MQKLVLFTGLVRRPEILGIYLDRINDVPPSDRPQTVLSTWHGHLNDLPDVRQLLHDRDVHVVESEEPERLFACHGHILHQAVAVGRGLAYSSDETHVMRTRSDFDFSYLLGQFIRNDLESVADVPISTSRRINKYKYKIAQFDTTWPFLWADVCFEGSAGDILRSFNASITDQIYYSNMVAEQYLFGSPFIADIRAQRAYFRVNQETKGHPPYVDIMKNVMARSDLFFMAIASNFLVLKDYTRMFLAPSNSGDEEVIAGFTLEQLMWDHVECPGLSYTPFLTNCFINETVLNVVLDGNHKGSAFGDRFRSALTTMRAGLCPEPCQLEAWAVTLGEDILRTLGGERLKYLTA